MSQNETAGLFKRFLAHTPTQKTQNVYQAYPNPDNGPSENPDFGLACGLQDVGAAAVRAQDGLPPVLKTLQNSLNLSGLTLKAETNTITNITVSKEFDGHTASITMQITGEPTQEHADTLRRRAALEL